MSLLLYRFFVGAYYMGIRLLSLWNVKARLWVKGRRTFPGIDYTGVNDVLWMHCASLGEFEQGRPLLEAVKISYPACRIVLSFFSASGYELVKNFKGAEHIFYLPEDGRGNARKLVQRVNPSLVLWVKYEYWFYYLDELKKKKVPVLLVSGVYRGSMPFFKWYGSLWKRMLDCFTHFFVQNEPSRAMLKKIVPAGKITNSGDTRFDRVITIAEKFHPVPGLKEFCGNRQVIVAGSTWEDDEAEWVHYVRIHPEIKFIIAPHEIDKENLAGLKKQFPGSIFYSEWISSTAEPSSVNFQLSTVNPQPSPHCLIIDNIGMLSRLYSYATVCYVGGGFGSDGLHNILEAAVYGKPVLFGPEYDKNFEALEMIACGGAISIGNAVTLEKVLNQLLNDTEELKTRGAAARNYVYSSAGATVKIMEFIMKNAFLRADQTVLQRDQNRSSLS